MGLVSLLLSLLSGVLTVLACLAAFVPLWGAALAFAAPSCALLGVIMGGLSMSRAGKEGRPKELSTVAIVFNMMAFFPALMVALTCGVCNAVLTAGPIDVQRSFTVQMGFPDPADAGLGGFGYRHRQAGRPASPSAAGADAAVPEDGLPPPPLPAGPSDDGRAL